MHPPTQSVSLDEPINIKYAFSWRSILGVVLISGIAILRNDAK